MFVWHKDIVASTGFEGEINAFLPPDVLLVAFLLEKGDGVFKIVLVH